MGLFAYNSCAAKDSVKVRRNGHRAGPKCLVLELFDFATVQTRGIGREFFANEFHQEVEREDVHNRHGKDRRIREVDHWAE